MSNKEKFGSQTQYNLQQHFHKLELFEKRYEQISTSFFQRGVEGLQEKQQNTKTRL